MSLKYFIDEVQKPVIQFRKEIKESFWRENGKVVHFLFVHSNTNKRTTFLLELDGMVSTYSAFYWKLCSNTVVLKVKSIWELSF